MLDRYISTEDFSHSKPSRKVVLLLVQDLFRERKLFFFGLFLVFTGTSATLLEPRIFGYAIDHGIIPRDVLALRNIGLVYLLVTTIRVSALALQSFFFAKLSQRMMDGLRSRLFLHLQSLPISTYDKTPVGRLVTRLTNDTSSMSDLFSDGFITMLSNLLFVLGSLIWLFVLNWKLALLSVSVFPVLIFFSIHFSRRLVKIYRESRMRLSALNAFLAENILGMKTVQLFNQEAKHLKQFEEVSQTYTQAQADSVSVYAYFQPLITWCSGLGVALVMAWGGKMTLEETLSQGEWVAFLTYIVSIFNPLRDLVDRWTLFLSGMTSAERIYQLMDWKSEIEPLRLCDEVQSSHSIRGDICFDQVWFSYEEDPQDEDWVLRDFSLSIEAGQKIGIVGHTGAGKSTLIGLLLRFYEPQKGRIFIDGRDIRELDRRELRDRIGLIQQDVFLFSGSVADNLHLFSRDHVTSLTQNTLSAIGFKHLLNKPLEERGSNLSMGEKQWIAFGRVLEKNPDLWILDEATAHVDSHSEIELSQALSRATQEGSYKKTLLMIAHRLATVREADLIIVLHRGQLVEKGSHQKLMEVGGYYARLYRYQSSLESLPEKLGSQSV
jgi:ATP-binding cassette subfamily B multidrug efflux pump